MTIGPWPRGCPELFVGIGVIQGARGQVIGDFSKGHTPRQESLLVRPSEVSHPPAISGLPRVRFSLPIKVPRVKSVKVTLPGTIMMCLGGGVEEYG